MSAERWVKPRTVAFGEPFRGDGAAGFQKLDGEPKEGWSRGGIRTVTMRSVQKLLTPKEVAEWLDVSVDWVHNHATRKAPRLPVVRIGKLLRFRNEDVEEFIRGQSRRNGKVLAANGRMTPETTWEGAETV